MVNARVLCSLIATVSSTPTVDPNHTIIFLLQLTMTIALCSPCSRARCLYNNSLSGTIPNGVLRDAHHLRFLYVCLSPLDLCKPEPCEYFSSPTYRDHNIIPPTYHVRYLYTNSLSWHHNSTPSQNAVPTLRVRDVHNNQLGGTIPPYLGNSLTSLYVFLTVRLRSKR